MSSFPMEKPATACKECKALLVKQRKVRARLGHMLQVH